MLSANNHEKNLEQKRGRKPPLLTATRKKRVEVGRPSTSTAHHAVKVTIDPLITDGSGPVCGALAQFLYTMACPSIK
jgi:hypothetical protein